MSVFLPMTKQDMAERGWGTLDFIFVSGDAYVDHPSFGPAILCRLLEKHGYRVGIIAQPDWRGREDFCQLGCPRLAFLVSSGNMDFYCSPCQTSCHLACFVKVRRFFTKATQGLSTEN